MRGFSSLAGTPYEVRTPTSFTVPVIIKLSPDKHRNSQLPFRRFRVISVLGDGYSIRQRQKVGPQKASTCLLAYFS